MAQILQLTFNPFQENTYVVANSQGECIIFDPGCYSTAEEKELTTALAERGWQPRRLINTHCHIDHVFGNAYISSHYGLPLEVHRLEVPLLEATPRIADMYGLPPMAPSPAPTVFLEEGQTVVLGDLELEIFLTPGHSPGSLCFYSRKDGFVIAGDVLFQRSVGRTDLPGGDYATLMGSIKAKLLPLPEETVVYPGHGPATTIGEEKRHNPFLTDN